MTFGAERKWRDRVASSLELIADRLAGPDRELVERVAHLEELLKEYVGLMENPDSTNQEWDDLLSDVKKAMTSS